MKKSVLWGIAVCVVLAFSSCKSSESAYKKAYEKAKQQELAEQQAAPAQETVAVVTTPVTTTTPAASTVPAGVRQEKVTVVSGGALKAFSVVCGAFGVKANAEGVKDKLAADGYGAMVVHNAERNLYRVVVSTFDDRASAESARDSFKARYPGNADFQKAWLLYVN